MNVDQVPPQPSLYLVHTQVENDTMRRKTMHLLLPPKQLTINSCLLTRSQEFDSV